MYRIGKAVSDIWAAFRSEEGASAVEYGLIVALIAVAIIAAVTLVGTNLADIFNTIADELTTGA